MVFAGAYAGLRASGKKADLALVVADKDAAVGGAFTQNVMVAAPCLYCKDVMTRKDTVRAVRSARGDELAFSFLFTPTRSLKIDKAAPS